MKGSTKFWLGASAAAGGIWAWMRYGNRPALAASRVVPPGYATATNVFDARNRPGTLYVYPIGVTIGGFVQKKSMMLFVPADTSQPGVWGEAPSRVPL